ncbi:NAD-dependent epimerase/dehydratase family protein [Acidobacteria bacterium AB60]|nr:NAD-dependent epimerase/dehydratase family protein [Acidobacteria bacterium AB60]
MALPLPLILRFMTKTAPRAPPYEHRPRLQPWASYTLIVNVSLNALDWSSFLARPRLPSPPLSVLDSLYRKPMLITGAGGSIGSALSKRATALAPSTLLLLDSSESRLYALQQDWIHAGLPGDIIPILGSVTDRRLLDEVFTAHAPKLVFHAAAFKHVPLLEQQPFAAIANNVFGTLSLVRTAVGHHSRVLLLSTDKAVEPTSIMGATKRISEQIVLSAGGVVLRLGNVLGTRGSVTETFALQIATGKRLTVTDPAARRYFLTVDEAVNLLLIAAAESDTPALLAPELPRPYFITDLAHFMAREFAPDQTPGLDFIGVRPGDKDAERFWSQIETPRPANELGLLSIQSPILTDAEIETRLAALRGAVDTRDLAAALSEIRQFVPDYTPSTVVQSLATHRVVS